MAFNCSYMHYNKRQKRLIEFNMKTSQDRGWPCKINYLKFPKVSLWLPKSQWYLKQDRILCKHHFRSNPKCGVRIYWKITETHTTASKLLRAGLSGKLNGSLGTGLPPSISVIGEAGIERLLTRMGGWEGSRFSLVSGKKWEGRVWTALAGGGDRRDASRVTSSSQPV